MEYIFGKNTIDSFIESKNIIAQIGGKPEERTKEYYDNRPCAVIVYNTAKILENYLIEQNIIK